VLPIARQVRPRAGIRSPCYGERVANARNTLVIGVPAPAGSAPVECRVSDSLVPYDEAVVTMEARAAEIAARRASELVWLLEHPPLYTAGTSANLADVIEARFPVHESGRGGQMTYHGPGQRIAYVMLDLKRRGPDVRRFVATLEEWTIRTLAAFNVRAERREDRIGVWVRRPEKGEGYEDKIAAIGIRVKQWVTLHGMALNVDPNLSHFSGIVPCGVREKRYGVTSLSDLGIPVSMAEVDMILRREFELLFGQITDQMVGSTENTSPSTRSMRSASLPSR
jgi:lipoyl(octanoyl) transferase